MAARTVVLAHGFLGFGKVPWFPQLVHYFHGVEKRLRGQGFQVINPQVNPIGSVAHRSGTLAQAILDLAAPEKSVDIIAHSMGGLDSRLAIAKSKQVAACVKNLITIGTPHHGSPVADAIIDHTGPLFKLSQTPPLQGLHFFTGALEDLTSKRCEALGAQAADDPSVNYHAIAGDALLGNAQSVLVKLAEIIQDATGEANDGLVTRSSALREEKPAAGGAKPADDPRIWPTDHFGEVGWQLQWPFPLPVGFKLDLPLKPVEHHFAWYDKIVERLK